MRPAGKEDVYKMLVGEGEVSEDTSLDEFLDLYDILVMEGKEPKAQPSVRFAKINGDTSQNFGSSGDFNSST